MPNRKRIIKRAAKRESISPRTLWGVYGAESNFGHNHNDSPAGAQGPFQFMPQTAAGLGIDPHNFKQAANAAAHYLGTYKSRGYAGMLAAYNAGPAGDPNNSETQAYIPKVRALGKTWPGAKGGEPSKPSRTVRRTSTQPADRKYAALQFLQDDSPDAVVNLAANLMSSSTTSKVRRTTTNTNAKAGGGGGSGASVSGVPSHPSSQLFELFWQGAGGIDVKDGKMVPQGFVDGHTDHVHVASHRKQLVRIGKLAQSMGLHVGENPHFGGVNPVHVNGSYHYQGRAIDVSGDTALMRKFAHKVARIYGIK
jgi:hypothetical protein